jgi:hypothetical protein
VIDPRSPQTVTDASGEYSLPTQQGNFLLVALDDAGYVEAGQDQAAKNGAIRLSAWGRLQGRFLWGTKPAVAQPLAAVLASGLPEGGPIQIAMVNRAQTDASGGFTMDRVCPGLNRVLWNGRQPNPMGFSGDIAMVQVQAGTPTVATLGGIGRPVVGRFLFPPEKHPADYFINARAGAYPEVETTTGPVEQIRCYLLEVDPQDNFRIENVLPGDYRIHIFLQKADRTRTQQPDEPGFTMPPIPTGVSDEPLVIADIQLQ